MISCSLINDVRPHFDIALHHFLIHVNFTNRTFAE